MIVKQPVYVVDIIKNVVERVSIELTQKLKLLHPQITGVHYLGGHHTEIRNRLITKGKTEPFDRYPLIAFFHDFVEDDPDNGDDFTADLQLIVLYHTNADDYTEDRYDRVIKPILFIIYREFIRQLKKHKNIEPEIGMRIAHKRIVRANWGNKVKYGNDSNIFSDVLDGIEIQLTKLTIKQNC